MKLIYNKITRTFSDVIKSFSQPEKVYVYVNTNLKKVTISTELSKVLTGYSPYWTRGDSINVIYSFDGVDKEKLKAELKELEKKGSRRFSDDVFLICKKYGSVNNVHLPGSEPIDEVKAKVKNAGINHPEKGF